MNTTRLAALALLIATGASADAQKYYARQKIAPAQAPAMPATPTRTTCGVPAPNNWLNAVNGTIEFGPAKTPEEAQALCNSKGPARNGVCYWGSGGGGTAGMGYDVPVMPFPNRGDLHAASCTAS